MIDAVPQIHQGRNECGPTSLAMVLNYWGVKKKKDELKDDLNWHPELGVSYQKMLRFPYKKYGFKVDFLKGGSIEKIMKCIAQDHPVIVRQYINFDKAYGAIGHWRVVIGYDHERGKIYMRDPAITTRGFSSLSYKAFLELWDLSMHSNPSKNLMLTLIPDKKKE
jgi:ABC-type bacteriocin/lantibiotic exporter with double-glycine peptidase domain